MKANVMAAVSLDSSSERFSGLVLSLTIAVEIVMVCGGPASIRGGQAPSATCNTRIEARKRQVSTSTDEERACAPPV